MAISNGFDEALVLPALTRRKGWEQPTVGSFGLMLAGDVITNESGLAYNRDHMACSPVTLLAVQEDSGISAANFNNYLLGLQSAVIMDALNGVFMQQQLIERPACLYSKSWLTDYKPIPNTGGFCGWRIDVAEGDYAVKVDAVTLLMSAPCTVTLHLYNDLVAAPLWTRAVTVPAGESQYVVNVDDLALHYADDTHKTGTFFLGYYQDELAGQNVTALDVYLDRFNDFNMLGYQGFRANADYGAKTFVRSLYESNYSTYGLNLELSSYHDFTNTIVRNASQFDRLLGMCMTARCIGEVMTSTRTNGTQRISEQQLELLWKELEGNTGAANTLYEFAVNIPYRTGLRNKIEREMWRMTQTFVPDGKVWVATPPVK